MESQVSYRLREPDLAVDAVFDFTAAFGFDIAVLAVAFLVPPRTVAVGII